MIVFCIAFLGFCLIYLFQESKITPEVGFLTAIIIGPFILVHIAERFSVRMSDPLLLPLTAFLSSLSLIMIYRLKPDFFNLQSLWILLGIAILIGSLLLTKNYERLKSYKYLFALLGLILLLSPILFGTEKYGAKLWLKIGAISFQPSEIAKILIVIFLAAYLEEKRELLSIANKRFLKIWIPEFKHFGPLLLMWLISLAILVFEKDLGSSLLFFGIFLSMLYVATGRKIYVIAGILLFLIGATSCYYLFPHVQTRIDIWLNPWQDVAGKGYQIAQSLFAIASGDLSGVGLGRGYPTYIPAVHTDFIFSALAEELGLIGGFAVIISYLIFVCRGFRIALAAKDEFGKLLAVGLTSAFALQVFIIIGGVTKLIPLTGITLPFMSYGGSSILANFILLALLLVISEKANTEGSA
jgi:cell division protein FtsW